MCFCFARRKWGRVTYRGWMIGLSGRKTMTDNEIDDVYYSIFFRRAENNRHFMDWWRETMKCPHCQPFAMKYQGLIRQNDIEISEANKPLCG